MSYYLIENQRLDEVVLQRYHLNFSSPYEVNALSKIDKRFVELIKTAFSNPSLFPKEQLQEFPLSVIIDYLKRTHFLYLNKRLPEIGQTIYLLRKNHKRLNVCLYLLDSIFKQYASHLSNHIQEEEQELFPYIELLISTKENKILASNTLNKIKEVPLSKFLIEHTDTEEDLHKAQVVIEKYQPPVTNKSPYRILLNQLESLKLDLHIHERIEEEILIPSALILEENILGTH